MGFLCPNAILPDGSKQPGTGTARIMPPHQFIIVQPRRMFTFVIVLKANCAPPI